MKEKVGKGFYAADPEASVCSAAGSDLSVQGRKRGPGVLAVAHGTARARAEPRVLQLSSWQCKYKKRLGIPCPVHDPRCREEWLLLVKGAEERLCGHQRPVRGFLPLARSCGAAGRESAVEMEGKGST